MVYGIRFVKHNLYLSEWGFQSIEEAQAKLKNYSEIFAEKNKTSKKEIFEKEGLEIRVIEEYNL